MNWIVLMMAVLARPAYVDLMQPKWSYIKLGYFLYPVICEMRNVYMSFAKFLKSVLSFWNALYSLSRKERACLSSSIGSIELFKIPFKSQYSTMFFSPAERNTVKSTSRIMKLYTKNTMYHKRCVWKFTCMLINHSKFKIKMPVSK